MWKEMRLVGKEPYELKNINVKNYDYMRKEIVGEKLNNYYFFIIKNDNKIII